jgi:hypothetical protein
MVLLLALQRTGSCQAVPSIYVVGSNGWRVFLQYAAQRLCLQERSVLLHMHPVGGQHLLLRIIII